MLSLIWPFDFIFTIFLGLCLGSFATAITVRELAGKPWLLPAKGSDAAQTYRSACPSCGHKLGVLDLFPILSWLFLRGRCRYCQQPISRLYPLLELGVLSAAILIYVCVGWSISAWFMFAALPFLAALIVIDFQKMILPNILVGTVFVIGLFYALYTDLHLGVPLPAFEGLMAALVYGGFVALLAFVVGKVLKKEALGGGDVKFFAVAGMWLGLEAFPVYCMLSGVMGVVLGAVWKMATGRAVFPFGPALIIALYCLWLFDLSLVTILE